MVLHLLEAGAAALKEFFLKSVELGKEDAHHSAELALQSSKRWLKDDIV